MFTAVLPQTADPIPAVLPSALSPLPRDYRGHHGIPVVPITVQLSKISHLICLSVISIAWTVTASTGYKCSFYSIYTFILRHVELLYYIISHLMLSTQASIVSYFTLHLLRVLYLMLLLVG